MLKFFIYCIKNPSYTLWLFKQVFSDFDFFCFSIKKYILLLFWYKTPPLKIITTDFDINKSFVRIWDWEILACLWSEVRFPTFVQKRDLRLKKTLNSIISYNWDRILIWLPLHFLVNDEDKTKDIVQLRTSRLFLKDKLVNNQMYWDAFYFRNFKSYNDFCDLYKNKKIILALNKFTLDSVFEKWWLSILWQVIIPDNNAWWEINLIKNKIVDIFENTLDKSNIVILISAWPAWKIITYELTIEKWYIVHDVWSMFDILLTKIYKKRS